MLARIPHALAVCMSSRLDQRRLPVRIVALGVAGEDPQRGVYCRVETLIATVGPGDEFAVLVLIDSPGSTQDAGVEQVVEAPPVDQFPLRQPDGRNDDPAKPDVWRSANRSSVSGRNLPPSRSSSETPDHGSIAISGTRCEVFAGVQATSSGARSSVVYSRVPVDAAGRYGCRKLPRSVSNESGPSTINCPPQCSQSTIACCCDWLSVWGSTSCHRR